MTSNPKTQQGIKYDRAEAKGNEPHEALLWLAAIVLSAAAALIWAAAAAFAFGCSIRLSYVLWENRSKGNQTFRYLGSAVILLFTLYEAYYFCFLMK